MFFLYLFLFSIFFTFSSNKLQIEWDGLKIDLSSCALITDTLNGISFDPRQIFKEFMLPSGKTKTKKYIEKLFDPNFICVSANESLLVNLVIDRKSLGFPEDKFLFPLLHECMIRGFSKKLPVEDLEKLKFFKDIRYLCFEYLKNNMKTCPELLPTFFNSIVEADHSIQSSPEWNELINSQDGECFLDALIGQDLYTLHLNDFDPNALSLLFKRIHLSKLCGINRIIISNSQINMTLFDLRKIIKSYSDLVLNNCHNLKIGTSEYERYKIMHYTIFHKYYNYSFPFIQFNNCSLDQMSLEQCKNFTHPVTMLKTFNKVILLMTFGLVICELLFNVDRSLFFTICSFIALGLSTPLLYDASFVPFVGVIRILHPIFLEDNFIFPYWFTSPFLIIGILLVSFIREYSLDRETMSSLIENPFRVMTKYHFLDIVCRLFFWI